VRLRAVHVAGRPAGVPDPAVSIGPNLRALAVYLVVFQHVLVERCQQLIADVTGGLYSLFFPGRRTLESFRDFGILPAFGGVVVSDRYANYFHSGWEHIAGNQACLAHLIRDSQDAAECCPRRDLAGAGTAGTARPDPRLACRP
jgi:hypothetical protein